MATFTLKANDTRPILEAVLRNPDGTVHDLTGTTDWKLNVRVNGSTVFTRTMVKEGLDTAGTLRYSWVAADWNDLPVPLSAYQKVDLYMEYEVIAGTSRMTFPNGGYDHLVIRRDVTVEAILGVSAVTLGVLTLSATGTVA